MIGAGSTGCVIASRLSEISDWNVLLLEAGTFRDEDLTGVPGLWIQDLFSKFNWGFKSVPQKNACLGEYSPFGNGFDNKHFGVQCCTFFESFPL